MIKVTNNTPASSVQMAVTPPNCGATGMTGSSVNISSVTLRMDFRGPDIGDFVYHCHILGHEDNGMMAIIRVLPTSAGRGLAPASSTPADAHLHPTKHGLAKVQDSIK